MKFYKISQKECDSLVGGTLDIGQDSDIISYTSKACKNLFGEQEQINGRKVFTHSIH